MNKKTWTPLLLLSSLLAFTACDDDDDDGLSGQAPNASQLGGSTISFNPTFLINGDASSAVILNLDDQAQFIEGVEERDILDEFNADVAVTSEAEREIEVTFDLTNSNQTQDSDANLRVVLRNFDLNEAVNEKRSAELDWFLETDDDGVIASRTGLSAEVETPQAVPDDQDGQQPATGTSPEPAALVEILTGGASFDPGTAVIEDLNNFSSGDSLTADVNLTQAGTDTLIDPSGNTAPATAPGVVTYEKTGDSTGLLTVTVDAIGVKVTANLLFQNGTSGIWNGSLTQNAENTVGDNEGEKLIVPIESGEPFQVITN